MNELYEHQKVALRKLSNGKILWGGVGSGKTRVAVEYYKLREAPRDVYVITTARKRDSLDWEKEFVDVGIGARTGPTTTSDRGNKKARSDDSGGHGESAARIDGAASGSVGVEREISGDESVGARSELGRSDGRAVSVENRKRLGDQPIDSAAERLDADGGLRGGIQSDARGQLDDRAGDSGDDSATRGNLVGRAGQYPYVLTVDSWNNLAKYADVAGAFFIFDEQRLVGSGEWSRKFLRIAKHNHWIMLSATPGDTWMDYIPLFVANGFYKNRTQFKREHVVYNTFTKFPKVDRYINVGVLAKHRADILVHMPFERHTRRRHVMVELNYDKELLDRVLKDRWHVYEERPLNDVAELFLVARRVVNSDPSRLEMVCELWKNHPKLIVFYNFNYELASLRSLRSLAEYYNIGVPTTRSVGISTPTNQQSTTTLAIAARNGSMRDGRNASSSSRKTLVVPSNSTTSQWDAESTRSESWKTNSEWATSHNPSMTGLQQNTDVTSSSRQINGPMSSSMGAPPVGLVDPSGRPISSTNLPEFTTPSSRMRTGSSTTAISSSSEIAEWNGHKHQPIPSTDRWLYLCQYTAAAEAWNCIETDAMIMYSLNYSWKVTEQSYGRIDRLNTPFTDLWYYNFMSNSFVDKAIKSSLDAKKTFNVKRYGGLFRD